MSNGDDMTALRRWMPAMLVAFGLAVSWGTFTTQIDVLAQDVDTLKQADSDHKERETVDKAEVAELKANQRAIKEDVQEIKARQKEQNEKLDKILDELRKN